MKYDKIVFFLFILIITTTMVTASDVDSNVEDTTPQTITSSRDTTHQVQKDIINDKKEYKQIIKNNKTLEQKTTAANELSINSMYASTYYGGNVAYSLRYKYKIDDYSYDYTYNVDGKIDFYIDNNLILSQNDDYGNIFWTYGEGCVAENYTGEHNILLRYTHENTTLEASDTLNFEKATPTITVGEETRIENGNIIVPVNIQAVYSNVKHGNINIKYQNNTISTTTLSGIEGIEFEDPVYFDVPIPGSYGQKELIIEYTDNNILLNTVEDSLYLDVVVPGTGGSDTTIEVLDIKLINTTHIDDDEIIIDSLNLNITTQVKADDTVLNTGKLIAYNENKIISTSNNPGYILVPAQYNNDEITIHYTTTGDYENSTITIIPQLDKQKTKCYISYTKAAKNSQILLYPIITSNMPYLYGRINVYLDDNLIQTKDIDNDTTISYKNNRSTIAVSVDLSGYDDGTYNLTIEAEENNIFQTSTYSSTLTIEPIGTYMYLNNRTIYRDSTTNLFAKIYANNKQTINNGQMSFYIDDQLIGTQYVDNATALIEYSTPTTLTEGKHNLTVIYEGDDTYQSCNKTVILTVAKTTTTTTLRTWTVNDEKITLNVTVRAWNKTINTGEVKAYIDNTQVSVATVNNNTAIITLSDTVTTDTQYPLKLVYTGTENLNTSTYTEEQFIFNKKNTTIRSYPYLRTNGTLTATTYIYTENYAKVNNGNITYKLNNQTIATSPVKDNKASLTYNMRHYPSGNYTFTAEYDGTILYRTNNNTTLITRMQYHEKTYMTFTNSSQRAKKGETININATIHAYSTNITEDIPAKLEIKTEDTVLYTLSATFTDGKLNRQLTIPPNITIEDELLANITITTYNTTNYQETKGNIKLHIGGEYTTLYQKTLFGYKQQNITFNTTLQNANKEKINTNTTVTVTIYTQDDEKITQWTGNLINGQYNYVYKLPDNLTENKYKAKITTKANNDYASTTRTVNITLNNRRTYISSTNIIAYVDSSIILNGTITDSTIRKQAQTNGEVTISIDGTPVATVNANNGTFKYTIKNNLTSGTHEVTYTYAGDDIYTNSTRTINLTSNKNTLRISAPSITSKIGQTVQITATITDNKGILIKEPLKANIELNGKTITTTDVTGGKLSYNYTIPTGTNSYTKITINILESNKYTSRYANTTLKINKEYQFINIPEATITTNTESRITITGNITNKYKTLLPNTKINIKIGNTDISNITSTDGTFTYEYTPTVPKGTYDITLTALENDNYLYNAKHMSLKVNS